MLVRGSFIKARQHEPMHPASTACVALRECSVWGNVWMVMPCCYCHAQSQASIHESPLLCPQLQDYTAILQVRCAADEARVCEIAGRQQGCWVYLISSIEGQEGGCQLGISVHYEMHLHIRHKAANGVVLDAA